jgi:methylated-DNA-protein-cysteine methyltransferase-like protein
MKNPDGTYQRIYRAVARIPRGRVATYGQVAALAGMPRAARQVGYALAALHDDGSGVPWHRVINASGEISMRAEPMFADLQRSMLESEGVEFDGRGRVSLERFGFGSRAGEAPKPKPRKAPGAAKPARRAKVAKKRKAVPKQKRR